MSTAPAYVENSRFFVTAPRSPPSDPAAPPTQVRYHYLDVRPTAKDVPIKAHLLLLHGFPDCGAASWRRLFGHLTSYGFRLIVPDLLGYGKTSSPTRAEGRLAEFGMRAMSVDLAGLLDHAQAGVGAGVGAPGWGGGSGKVVVVAHDWGAGLAWKFVSVYPSRCLGVATVCVPYMSPTSMSVPLDIVLEHLPNFGYQAFFADPRSTEIINKNLDRFTKMVFVGPGLFPNVKRSSDWVKLGQLEKYLTAKEDPPSSGAALYTPEEHLAHVQFFKGKMDGPLNWYRTRDINALEDEGRDDLDGEITCPVLGLIPDKDSALPKTMWENSGDSLPNFRSAELQNCGHWAMLEQPARICFEVERWVREEILRKSSL
ncbi:hypothetical protein A4X06_0g1076 [Tilletia controversa]|uniref:AB hydrolase-1 domain-containing protein n=1 Tax=Tilletia controversa TaxID=13291 RepID=A0A8X7MY42_9BASI|nr:hypothetical protein A4X06_0g1076 [Tilletia controversa]CAD6982788.1 unnamed protein product [Tilletia controversa]